MRRLYLLLGAMVTWQGLAGDGHAQLVQVGPGYVRAPFVCVEWWCGGSHVRAPFVDVHSGHARRQLPVGLTTEAALRRELAAASDELYDSLGRFDTAEKWREHLMIAPGMALSADALDRQPDGESLDKALANFHAVSGAADYAMIARLPAFVGMQDLLEAYVRERQVMAKPPEELPRPAPG